MAGPESVGFGPKRAPKARLFDAIPAPILATEPRGPDANRRIPRKSTPQSKSMMEKRKIIQMHRQLPCSGEQSADLTMGRPWIIPREDIL